MCCSLWIAVNPDGSAAGSALDTSGMLHLPRSILAFTPNLGASLGFPRRGYVLSPTRPGTLQRVHPGGPDALPWSWFQAIARPFPMSEGPGSRAAPRDLDSILTLESEWLIRCFLMAKLSTSRLHDAIVDAFSPFTSP